MKAKAEELGFLKGVILLYLLGFVIGFGIFLGFQEKLTDGVYGFYADLIYNLEHYEISSIELLKKVIVTEFQSFFLLALFGISILGIPYIFCFLVGNGVLGGFLLGSMLITFGSKGILVSVLYGFPQVFLYVPVKLAMIHKSYDMGMYGLKKKLLLEQIPSVIILLGILLAGCFMEAYVNTWILKKILLWLG